jgi:two-component system phosphate regulon response regulator PhoB
MTLASILVVDADTAAQQQIVSSLRELGHDVSATENARAAFSAMQHKRPDLLVCDCQLPDLAGVDLLSDLKQNDELRSMRVLMTSAQSTVDCAVSALELGADDFVPKPLNMQEFLARVAACLRRPATLLRADSISAGGITIDNIGHRVTADGSFLSLAPREYDLLLFLLNNQNRVFSRRQLLAHVWGRDAIVGPRTVDVHIRRLRNLLEPYSYAKYIQTVRGSGYRFSLER